MAQSTGERPALVAPREAASIPIRSAPEGGKGILQNPERFEFMQRVARLYSESQLVPQHLRGKVADCFIALQMADAMNEDPLMVLQNIYIVAGRAGWSAQYMIARANRSGKFRGPLRWRSTGQGDALTVTCFADLAHVTEGQRVEVTLDMATAKSDGWTRNEKYKSIPEAMLTWRTASWLVRRYCPEVMMGLPTADELEDTRRAAAWDDGLQDVTPEHRPAELVADDTEAKSPAEESAPRRRGRPPGSRNALPATAVAESDEPAPASPPPPPAASPEPEPPPEQQRRVVFD
jgi:hypothetical protein